MRFFSESLGLPDSAFCLLRDLIHEHTGLNYETFNRDLLAEKLSPRVLACGFTSFLDYYYLLKYDEAGQEEWEYVMDALSVQETFFWREMDQIHALVNVLVPEYFANDPKVPLKIWSAASASGEEPVTIAMALNEAGWLKKAPIEIYASDGSKDAIAKAKTGLYRERSFRNLDPSLKAKYFHPLGDNQWQVIPEIHSRIHWKMANLMAESQIKYLANANIIFCRNVFIYFSPKSIQKTVQLFHKNMPQIAYLCIAASESLLKLTNDFELQEIGGAFIYTKR